MSLKTVLVTGLAVATVFSTAGCDNGYKPAPNLSYEIDKPATYRPATAVAGTLVWDGTCLYLKSSNPESKRSVVVFERGGATVQDGKVLYGDKTYDNGNKIQWAGNIRTTSPVSSWAKVAPGCSDYEHASHVYTPL